MPSLHCLALCSWTTSFPSQCLQLGGLRKLEVGDTKSLVGALSPQLALRVGAGRCVCGGGGLFNRRPLRILLIFCQEVRDLGGELGVPRRSSTNNRKQPAQGKGTPLGTWEAEENLGSLLVGWEAGFKTQQWK